jgi:membrane protease YdiL (CAAX protease family)
MSSAKLRSFMVWLLVLYGGWLVAWIAHELLVRGSSTVLADRTTDTAYWLACKIVVWIVPVALFIRRETGTWNAFEWLGLSTARGVMLALPVCAVWLGIQAAAGLLVFHRVPRPVPVDAGGLSALVVSPLFEEILFRGFALRRLRERRVRASVAVGLTACAWALLHLPGWLFQGQSIAQVSIHLGGITIFGIVLGAVRLRAPSLWAPILVHLANNAWHEGMLTRLLEGLTG